MGVRRVGLRVGHMTIDTGDALLLVDRVWEIHTHVLVTVHAQLGSVGVLGRAVARGDDLEGGAGSWQVVQFIPR